MVDYTTNVRPLPLAELNSLSLGPDNEFDKLSQCTGARDSLQSEVEY